MSKPINEIESQPRFVAIRLEEGRLRSDMSKAIKHCIFMTVIIGISLNRIVDLLVCLAVLTKSTMIITRPNLD
uniref:Uncharacterized protein n=1 Tax=Syphacia muris TaxID=451379 RepID=A0A0N5APB0_9BILA